MSQASKTALTWTIREHSAGKTLILDGEISEHTSLDPLLKDLGETSAVTIDTYAINRINSVGVREWVNFLRQLGDQCAVTLIRCSPAVVSQLNSVFNFRASATVRSVAAPYFCQPCDDEQLEIITIPERIKSPSELTGGEHLCKKCGAEMEFDDLADRYFLFLHSTGSYRTVT